MEIIVQGYKIDTKDIFDIYEVEKYKKMFFNREAGFIIKMIGGQEYKFSENIPYESYPHEISEIKGKWKKLRKSVKEKWEQDRNDLPVFKV